MSDSVRPHRQQPTRLSHPWDSPGKNSGVGCHFPLQCMKVKSESEVTQLCLTLSDHMDCSLQAPPSMGFSRQEYWSGVPLPSSYYRYLHRQHLRTATTSVSGKTSTICTQANTKGPSSPSYPGMAPFLRKEADANQGGNTLKGDGTSSDPTFKTSAPTTWEQALSPPEPVMATEQRTSPRNTWL